MNSDKLRFGHKLAEIQAFGIAKVSSQQTRITFINRTQAAGPFSNYISNPGTRDTTFHSLKNLIDRLKDLQQGRSGKKWDVPVNPQEVTLNLYTHRKPVQSIRPLYIV